MDDQARREREVGFRRKATGSALMVLGAIALVTAIAVWQLPSEGEPARQAASQDAGTADEPSASPAVAGTETLRGSAPILAVLGPVALCAGGILWRVGDRATGPPRDRHGRDDPSGSS